MVGNCPMKPAKPVTVHGVAYASMAEAGRALGLTRSAVSTAAKKGKLDLLGQPKSTPITIRGVKYDSAKSASKALGITVFAIYNALNRGTLDGAGRGPGSSPRSNGKVTTISVRHPIKIGPKTYPSMAAACRALNLSKGKVKKYQLATNQQPEPKAKLLRIGHQK